MAFHIITDSASDLPAEIREKYRVHVIATPFLMDGVSYLDGEKWSAKEFYELMDQPEHKFSTSKINTYSFEEAFEPYARRGDEVLYLCISSGISGAVDSAHLAAENVKARYPEFKITIQDTLSAAIGQGLLVYKLLLMQENGAPKELILEAAAAYSGHIRHVFTVLNLKNLIRGGRLGRGAGIVGEALDIKPLLVIENDGVIRSVHKIRGRKKSLRVLLNYPQKNGFDLKDQIIATCHGEDPDTISEINMSLKAQYDPGQLLCATVGSVIGIHTGRGMIGLAFPDFDDRKYREYQKIQPAEKGY